MAKQKLRLEPNYQQAYWDVMNNPSPQTNAAFVMALQPIVRNAIMAAGGDPKDNLMLARARKMVMDSISRYDPYNAPLKTFLYGQLMGLNRVVGNQANVTGISEDVSRDINKLNAAEKEFEQEFGYFPSTAELADRTGISPKRITKLRQSHVPITEAMLEERFGINTPQSKIVGDTKKDDAWMNFVYHDMAPRTQAVMERLYGMNGYQPMQARDVAKALNISDAAVSQHRKNIDKLLNSDAQYSVFGE